MESESNVIPFVLRAARQTVDGYQVISPKELIQSHPGAARALFDSAKESYHMAMQTLGFLEDALKEITGPTSCANDDPKAASFYDVEDINLLNNYWADFSESHTAEIIDAKDPEVWKSKNKQYCQMIKNNISP